MLVRGGDSTDVEDVRAMVGALAGLRRDEESDAVEQITALEELVCAARAAQARATVDLWTMRTDRERAMEVPREQIGKGLAAEVALARREAPGRGSQHLGLAKALNAELPRTMALMEAGQVSEWRAILLLKEVVGLSPEDRRTVDAELEEDLPTYGDGQVRNHARRVAMRLDADHAAARREHERGRRRVSVRPAAGSMAYLTAHLPMTDAVRVHASLARQAAGLTQAGEAEGRTPGQLAADLLVERVTGSRADAPRDVDLTVVMTDQTLAGSNEPAWIPGQGPLPADTAREQVREARSVWFRRLWTDPASGGAAALESRSRAFTGTLRRLILIRDDVCRTPYCTNPAEQVDHSTDWAEGGTTSADNASGLCASCNYAKQHPGWRHAADPDGRLDVYTPTGHRYSVPRSPFPFRVRPPGPEMTAERYAQLKARVADRVAHNRRNEQPAVQSAEQRRPGGDGAPGTSSARPRGQTEGSTDPPA